MASNSMKNFAIKNNLTVDYGYTFGKYRGFYLSIKEGVSYRILQIVTNLGENKDTLRTILKIFDKDLAKFCVNDFKFEKKYIEFNFNLGADKAELVIEFLNRFIDEIEKINYQNIIICPICNQILKDEEEIEMINYRGIIQPAHNQCFEKGKKEVVEKVKIENQELNKGKSYKKGILGAFVFSVIYILVMIGAYCLTVKGIEALSNANNTPEGISQNAFQYLPLFFCLGSVPFIAKGYEVFKGKQGTHKYLIVLLFSFISSLISVVLGIFLSFILVATGKEGMSIIELFKKVFEILYIYNSTRFMLFLSLILSIVLTAISIIFKFGSYKELKEAESETIEKL